MVTWHVLRINFFLSRALCFALKGQVELLVLLQVEDIWVASTINQAEFANPSLRHLDAW